ncbi:hypothetical protein CPB86DRAFT_822835 [Serendipita vermifera]|nr:hypothetical protein CPB86DRAFT_822835 [Serendipita vermifera]
MPPTDERGRRRLESRREEKREERKGEKKMEEKTEAGQMLCSQNTVMRRKGTRDTVTEEMADNMTGVNPYRKIYCCVWYSQASGRSSIKEETKEALYPYSVWSEEVLRVSAIGSDIEADNNQPSLDSGRGVQTVHYHFINVCLQRHAQGSIRHNAQRAIAIENGEVIETDSDSDDEPDETETSVVEVVKICEMLETARMKKGVEGGFEINTKLKYSGQTLYKQRLGIH